MNEADKAWMQVLIDYAVDWDETFRVHHRNYFTQEYWYLFTACTQAHIEGKPLTVGEAIKAMRVGGPKKCGQKIAKAETDGYLVKRKGEGDGREQLVIPTDKLVQLLSGHLARTRLAAWKVLKEHGKI